MKDPILLPSGALLVVQSASFEQAAALRKAVARELANVKTDISDLDLEHVSGKDFDSIKALLFTLLGSDVVESALWACMPSSLINSEPVRPSYFQPENTREDYMIVAWEVMAHNLGPFVKSLLSLFPKTKKAAPQTTNAPTSG